MPDTVTAPILCGLTLDRPRVMAILNVTPDSFSDGGLLADLPAVVDRARVLSRDADILDIGGESTRPGADPVDEATERARVIPAIRAIREAGIATPISIDTRKAAIARAAVAAGAGMVNDVSAMTHDPAMAETVAALGVPVCLMHAQGDPRTMQDAPRYGDVLAEVRDFLAVRAEAAMAAGIARDCVLIDPGIGFGKTAAHNIALLRGLRELLALGFPVLVGLSRKRFVGTITGVDRAADRVAGSLAGAIFAAARGAAVIRVHDAAETRQALAMMAALEGG